VVEGSNAEGVRRTVGSDIIKELGMVDKLLLILDRIRALAGVVRPIPAPVEAGS
jgi:hypothetical protein